LRIYRSLALNHGVGLDLHQRLCLKRVTAKQCVGADYEPFPRRRHRRERAALVEVRLSGSAVTVVGARGQDVSAHLLERMRLAVGTLPNDGKRYDNVILNQPKN
jgi:hypothetical protein